jgi:hypothetical protein
VDWIFEAFFGMWVLFGRRYKENIVGNEKVRDEIGKRAFAGISFR